MTTQEAIDLIRHDSNSFNTKTTWADLGCGSGVFTNALGNLLSDGSVIYAVDKKIASFNRSGIPSAIIVNPLKLDFEIGPFPFENLDGILMANSLHFIKDKLSLLRKLDGTLKEGGLFLIVEYDTDSSNFWVPYPISFPTLEKVFKSAGYTDIIRMHEMPSKFNRARLYSAIISK